MGLFGLFKGSDKAPKEEKKALPWQKLETVAQLDTIAERSKGKMQILFKHSTRCGISKMVIKQFESAYSLEDTAADLYYLDLLNYRDVSRAIGEKFEVFHQSPQLIVIKNGIAVHHASHSEIDATALEALV